MKSIEVIIKPDGSIQIDAVGFKGAACEKATAFLEQALGKIAGRQKKPEYHLRAVRQQQIGGQA